ncbi:MAG TPA: primosomal protein N' [Dehalococcoidia bacterium]|nr:primosomal protein N' [Dehalococcoidia bacterium]
MLYAEVAVNSSFPHRQTFSYRVPDGLDVRAGAAVYVPFGRLTLQGIVLETHGTPVFSEPEKIRPVRALIGEAPLLDERRVALAQWVAHEYVAPVFDAVALLLPPGFERRPVTVVRSLVDPAEIDGLDLPHRQIEVLRALAPHGRMDLERLRETGVPGVDAAVVQLERRGYALREYALARPRVSAKSVEVASLAQPEAEARAAVARAELPRRSRRADVLELLLTRGRAAAETAQRIAGGRGALDRLLAAGAVRLDREARDVLLALPVDEAARRIAALRRTRRATEAGAIVEALAATGEMDVPALRAATGASAATVRWLAEVGAVALRERAVERDPLAHMEVVRREPAALLPRQQAAADAIGGALRAGRSQTFLLHGVTGSGKTEVYLDALERCIAAGRRAIVLVPEIALTPQTVRRFRERVAGVAVLHSGLTDGERFDQWHGIAAGRYDVVIGPRSAVFAPQPDLGLIVVDEEHEWTYKQAEPPPRYHARAVAGELARLFGATLVLGSATPDVETYERAARGEITLLDLPERVRPVIGPDGVRRPVASTALPQVSVVDLRDELHAGNRGIFSRELRAAVEEALAADEQVILFLNRRGLAGHVQCRDCGYVPVCPSCQVALTYHRQYDRLVCHQCNRQSRLPVACRTCGSPRLRLLGLGVEKVEVEAERAFPQARLLRWDRDVTRERHAHERILAAFLAHEADILIGTQMLAKGLDLPAVTVVGVISADVGLHLPDFRAGERVFQLLTQVAGRAGRGERPGRVIIQTYTPDDYAVEAAARYDYEGFAAAELEARRSAGYPPFGRIVRLLFAHTNQRFARDEASRVQRALSVRRAELGLDADVIGPTPPYVPRLRGHWRYQVLLRGRDPAALVRDFVLPPNWAVDVDPASLL